METRVRGAVTFGIGTAIGFCAVNFLSNRLQAFRQAEAAKALAYITEQDEERKRRLEGKDQHDG